MNLPGAVVFCSIQPCSERASGDITEENYYGSEQVWAICDKHATLLGSMVEKARDQEDANRIVREFINGVKDLSTIVRV